MHRADDAWIPLIAFGLLGLVATCIADYAKSTPQARDALIYDKKHVPGHYETDCHRDSHDRLDCRQRWIAPTWTLIYDDSDGRHRSSVSKDTYQRIRVGQPVFVTFYEGSYLGIRWSTHFAVESPVLEK